MPRLKLSIQKEQKNCTGLQLGTLLWGFLSRLSLQIENTQKEKAQKVQSTALSLTLYQESYLFQKIFACLAAQTKHGATFFTQALPVLCLSKPLIGIDAQDVYRLHFAKKLIRIQQTNLSS